jgi:hypothetical protein
MLFIKSTVVNRFSRILDPPNLILGGYAYTLVNK